LIAIADYMVVEGSETNSTVIGAFTSSISISTAV
jgi:hypothetical protein